MTTEIIFLVRQVGGVYHGKITVIHQFLTSETCAGQPGVRRRQKITLISVGSEPLRLAGRVATGHSLQLPPLKTSFSAEQPISLGE